MQGGGRQGHLLGRLLGKLRGEHRYNATSCSTTRANEGVSGAGLYTSTSESTACGSSFYMNDATDGTTQGASSCSFDAQQFAANIDLRYGGQYLTPEQLPEFCNQLHNLVEVIRNIQSYAKVTGEYPSSVERRLEREAREVSALCGELRHALSATERAHRQRAALRTERDTLLAKLSELRGEKLRELEASARLADRKMFKSWEALKDSTDPAAFDPLIDEVTAKQMALQCLLRLIESRRESLRHPPPAPQPLPPPPLTYENHNGSRRGSKRRRREHVRSEPISGETSRHAPIVECSSRYRVGSAGAVTLTPLELPSRGSVRDIVFFTLN